MDELLLSIKRQAHLMLDDDVRPKISDSKLSSNNKYLAAMINTGTLSDRVDALSPTPGAYRLHSLYIIHMYGSKCTTRRMSSFHERPHQQRACYYDENEDIKRNI